MKVSEVQKGEQVELPLNALSTEISLIGIGREIHSSRRQQHDERNGKFVMTPRGRR